MTLLTSQEHLFDIPSNIVYLNCAANGPQLKQTTEKLYQGADFKSSPWKRQTSDFFETAEKIRILSSEIFGGSPDNYAIVPSTSYGIATVAQIIENQIDAKDEIIVLEQEFPSTVLSLTNLAKRRGATIKIATRKNDESWLDAILREITSKTKVFALSTCHWTNGETVELETISEICQASGLILCVDATQTLGAVPLPLNVLKPDFVIASGYKWLLSPYGFALFYVDKKWTESRPLEETWVARKQAYEYELNQVTGNQSVYRAGARRFDVGQTCTPTILPGVISALEQIKCWGVDNICESLENLNRQLLKILIERGFDNRFMVKPSPNFFGVLPPPDQSFNWIENLSQSDVFTSLRGPFLRVSPHLHLTRSQIGRFEIAIDRLTHPELRELSAPLAQE